MAIRNAVIVLVLMALACGGASAECTPEWARGLFPVWADLNGPVWALCVYNGELYAGGDFWEADGVLVNCIAKWNGTSWQPVGTGTDERVWVLALCVYDGELYAGGVFNTCGGVSANNIAKWNGVSWQPVGTGVE